MSSKCGCGKPTSGAVLCGKCIGTTEIALVNVAAYYGDLETVRNRQTRYGTPGKRVVGKTRPLGMDLRFDTDGPGTKAQKATETSMRAWVKATSEAVARKPKRDTVQSACMFLQNHLSTIAGLEWASAFKSDLLARETQLRHVVDRPVDGWFAGPCGNEIEPDRSHDGHTCWCACHTIGDCDVPGGCSPELTVIPGMTCARVLYATPGEPFVKCRDCGRTWDVAERRETLLARAENEEATVRILARIITTLADTGASEAKLENRINQWVYRGKLRALGVRVFDGKPRSVYRVGDVLDLLADDAKGATA